MLHGKPLGREAARPPASVPRGRAVDRFLSCPPPWGPLRGSSGSRSAVPRPLTGVSSARLPDPCRRPFTVTDIGNTPVLQRPHSRSMSRTAGLRHPFLSLIQKVMPYEFQLHFPQFCHQLRWRICDVSFGHEVSGPRIPPSTPPGDHPH